MAHTVAIHATVHQTAVRNMSATVAWQRKSIQLGVGVPRRRAAPRGQSYGAAHVALCHFIGKRDPLNLHCLSEIHRPNASEIQMKMFLVSLAFRVKRPVRCGLTIRSTGPIAAGRHLGYKSLAQMPSRRNGPVSSNVRRHRRKP